MNHCKCGYYCSCYLTQEQIEECHNNLPEDWNGLCSYQNGRALPAVLNENGCIDIECDMCGHRNGTGCEMSPSEYIRWNGRCAYQDIEPFPPPSPYELCDDPPPKVEIVERPIYRR